MPKPLKIRDSIYALITRSELRRVAKVYPDVVQELDPRPDDEVPPTLEGRLSIVGDAELFARLSEKGFVFKVDEVRTACTNEGMNQVSLGNRFVNAESVFQYDPLDPASANFYFNTAEIASFLNHLEALYPEWIEAIPLGNVTSEGRASRAIRVARKSARRDGKSRPIVLLISGVHGKEWAGPDACIGLVTILLRNAFANTSIAWGSLTLPAPLLHRMLDEIDLIVLPLVNPDGRVQSQEKKEQWRKNKNANGSSLPEEHGVDINRNYKFLWHLGYGASASNRSDLYQGARVESEPETQNVVQLIQCLRRVSLFVDVHSYGQLILHSWANAPSQGNNSGGSFLYCDQDKRVGCDPDRGYAEYMPAAFGGALQGTAQFMRSAIIQSGGASYAAGAASVLGPRTGTSQDYVFSLNSFADTNVTPTLAYTFEIGRCFQPPYGEVRDATREVSAAILSACKALI